MQDDYRISGNPLMLMLVNVWLKYLSLLFFQTYHLQVFSRQDKPRKQVEMASFVNYSHFFI